MITVISGTNRRDSICHIFAKKYVEILQSKTKEEVKLLALENIPHDWFHAAMYDTGKQTPSLTKIQNEYMLPAQKFVYVLSEYNGGVPGSLKLFIDACSVREYKATFKGKVAALSGIASGRAGNLRGMDHLTSVLNHVGTHVLPNKLPISGIAALMNEDMEVTHPATLLAMDNLMDELLLF